MQKIISSLKKTLDEKGVEQILNKYFDITNKIIRYANSDGVFDDKLFEYKFDEKFNENGNWKKSAYKALAQSICYLKKFSNFEIDGIDNLPPLIVICDKNGGFIISSKTFETIINEDSINFDWNKQPSNPDIQLINHLFNNKYLQNVKYYEFDSEDKVSLFKKHIMTNDAVEHPQILITEKNFIHIFNLWKTKLLSNINNSRELVDIFISDIEMLFLHIKTTNELINSDNIRINVPINIYNQFWSFYKRPPSSEVRKYILANKDRLYDNETRVDFGDRYTPKQLANLSFEYLTSQFPDILTSNDYVFWDCAAGGANLLIDIPNKNNVILTTLFDEDVKTLKNSPYLKGATVEKLNFLKDIIPNSIKDKVQKAKKVVFFINPPFNDQTGVSNTDHKNPNDVDSTFYKLGLKPNDLRAVYAKFIYQITNIINKLELKNVIVGFYSTTSWINGINYENFRKFWFEKYNFNKGFIIPSTVFTDITSKWPIMFSLWSYNKDNHNQQFEFNVYNNRYALIGNKYYSTLQNKKRLRFLIKKQEQKHLVESVPLKNEYQVYDRDHVYLDKKIENSFGYFRIISNDIQNSGDRLIIISAPFGGSNHNGVFITTDNYENILMTYGIRKSINRNWINEKDEFLLDDKVMNYFETGSTTEITQLLETLECLETKSILWSICEGSYTSSLYKLKYKKNVFDVKNYLFALTDDDIQDLPNCNTRLLENDETIAAQWIKTNQAKFSQSELNLFNSYKTLITETISRGLRLSGEIKRQVNNPYASPRQLINGIYKYEGSNLSEIDQHIFDDYLLNIKLVKKEIENLVYTLNIIGKTQIKTKHQKAG